MSNCPAGATTPNVIEFDNFTLRYGKRTVLQNINLQIPAGACVGIIGPNGSGKTSLLRSIVGLTRPSEGQVLVAGKYPERSWRRQHQIGYVPQLKTIDKEFPISVYEVALHGRTGRLGLFHAPRKQDHLVVEDALRRVNMWQLRNRPIGELSGGQLQRVFIARALAQESQLLLLDEPGTGLDIPTQQSIYELLEELHGDGVTTLTTTHDLAALEFHHFDRILCLNQELIAFGLPMEVLTPDTLARTFRGVMLPDRLAASLLIRQQRED